MTCLKDNLENTLSTSLKVKNQKESQIIWQYGKKILPMRKDFDEYQQLLSYYANWSKYSGRSWLP